MTPLLLVAAVALIAQPATNAQSQARSDSVRLVASPSSITPASAGNAVLTTDSLIVAIRTETATLLSAHDQLVSIVQWSLSTVAGVGLLLVGFSWFNNNRSYERDKQALRQELRGFLQEEFGREAENNRQSTAKNEAQLEMRFDKLRADVVSLTETRTTAATAALRGELAGLRSDIRGLRIAATEERMRQCESEELWDSACDHAVELLSFANQSSSEQWRIPDVLHSVLRYVNHGAASSVSWFSVNVTGGWCYSGIVRAG